MKKIAELIEMSEHGLHASMKKDTLTIKNLEKIASVLEVPVSYFFEESKAEVKKIIGNGNNVNIGKNNGNNKTHTDCDKYKIEIKGLKKEIEYLKEINELLKLKCS